MDIQPQLLTLNKLLNGRLFRIPQYQRAYSWQTKQRSDLFADIGKLRGGGPDDAHFMATVVGLRRERRDIRTTEHQVIEVVDGQQRLTSLVLLLKAVSQLLDAEDEDQADIHCEIESLLVKEDNVSLLLLQTNHDSSHYFATYLRTGKHPPIGEAVTLADRELLRAIDESEGFAKKWLADGGSLIELITLLKNRLVFILHEISDERIVYTVFEVLNSRGLDVSWFDRAKTMLMGLAFESNVGNHDEIINELHQIWSNIYAAVGLRQGLSTESLRFAATLRSRFRPSRPLSEEDAVAELKVAAMASETGVLEVSNWLLRVTKAVDSLLTDPRRAGVTEISQARLLAVALLLRDDLTVAQRDELLDGWEKVSFRIYGLCRKDARTKVGEYVRLSWEVARRAPSFETTRTEIRRLGADFSTEVVAKQLAEFEDFYNGWQTELRYFFFRREEWLARQSGQNFSNEQWARIWNSNASDSIEHIRAQSWRSAWVQGIGNLVLLPPRLNSKLKDKSPEAKKDDYVRTGLLIAEEVARQIPPWSYADAVRRANDLVAWAIAEWAESPTP